METESAALWNREELFRRFVESSDDLVTVVDLEGHFIYVNPAAKSVFGIEPAKCLGRSAWDFLHPEDVEPTRAAFDGWLARNDSSPITFENRQVSSTGEVRHMLWTVTRQLDEEGKPVCFTSGARDITAIRRYEKELEGSESTHRSVLGGLLDPLVLIDAVGTIQNANSSCTEVFGFTPEELIGRNISLLMPEPHRSEHDAHLRRYQETGKTWILGRTRELEAVRKDGKRIVVDLSVSRIDVPESKEPLFSGSFRDVTARKEAERSLAESEQRFRAIFDREFEFVGLLRPDGTLLEANRTVLEVAGVERDDVVGRPFWETPWWSHSAAARDDLRAAIRRAAGGEFVRFETEHVGASGEVFIVDFSIKPIRDDAGHVVLLIPEGRDITEIKRAQQRETAMMRAFAEIGESASLLAHEIKNPITSVNLALRAVSRQLGEDEKEILEDLVERMRKLEKLMRRTLSLARPLDLQRSPCDPGQLLEAAVRSMAAHCEAVDVKLSAEAPELPAVSIDRQLMEDVLTNLIRNAVESVEAAGNIQLSARSSGNDVVIRIDDDGPGIPEKVQATLFKPFVTTKSSGTGLGLAIVRKVVEAHGGTIEVHDADLGGARFEIRLAAAPT